MPNNTTLEKNEGRMTTESILSEKTFEQLKNKIQLSESARRKLYNININTRHTSCGKKIILSNLLIVIIICAMLLPTTIFASNLAIHIMAQKVDKEVNLSDYELEQLYQELKEQGYSDEQILELSSLRINDNGLTYGPECMDPDLILVTSDQGNDGYVYREDFYYGTDFSTPEEALAWQEEFYREHPNGYSINVYECDGETIIGTFTFQTAREVK